MYENYYYMGKIDKVYVRTIRDDLGRYATWPISYPMELGMIGFYHGRSASFEWINNLENLGISVEPTAPQGLMDNMYCSKEAVTYNFNTESGSKNGIASFKFSKNRTIASQGFDFEYSTIPLGVLSAKLSKAISDGLEWNSKWVIVTEVWMTKGYTALISGSKNSHTEIKTSIPIDNDIFNIANTELGLSVSKAKQMGFQGVAKPGIKPYFQIHRLIYNPKTGWYMKKYGHNMSFFPDLVK